MDAGAAVARMEEAWYSPSSVQPNGLTVLHNPDRTRPHSIIVDATGQRYVDEAANYNYVAKEMYRRNEEVPAIPSWLIIDSQHRRKYPFVASPPGRTPKKWIRSGYMKKAPSLRALAEQCGIDPEGLERTVERFNTMARSGRDEDFQRGESYYDQYYGDPTHLPNPTLGEIRRAPFFAVELIPGDIGTCGGLVTTKDSEVLGQEGVPIAGLYAVGNIATSIGAGRNWGAGATIGSGMVFGYRAARHAAQVSMSQQDK
jgi:3-oxosteroid 1-dehydrogenase